MFDAKIESVRLAWTRYLDTTRDLIAKHGMPDLVVWPESTFTGGVAWIDNRLPTRLPKELKQGGLDRQFVQDWIQRSGQEFEFKTKLLLGTTQAAPDSTSQRPHFLLGCDALEVSSEQLYRYNAAIFVGPDGAYIDRYNKMHLVMFGEYIPLGPLLQWLRDMFGMPGATPGDSPKCFAVGEAKISPSICFESMLPRVIRSQVAELKNQGEAPDALINVTNDSWFRGSSMLDHHLACAVLCAVENRRPIAVSANTGISAEIDGCGRVLQRLDRFEVGGILAQPKADSRWGLVQSAGYLIGWLCGGLVLLGCSQMVLEYSRSKSKPSDTK